MFYKRLVASGCMLGLMLTGVSTMASLRSQIKTKLPSIEKIAQQPEVISALLQANKSHISLTRQAAKNQDRTWRQELHATHQPMISRVSNNALSKYLKSKLATTQGLVSSMIVLDDKAINIGQTNVASRYWFGNQSEWLRPMAGHQYISRTKTDPKTHNKYLVVGLPIRQTAGEKPIGALVVTLNKAKIIS